MPWHSLFLCHIQPLGMEDATPIEGGCVATHPDGSRACLSFVSTWMTRSLNKQSRFRDMDPFLTVFTELLSLHALSEEHLPHGTTVASHIPPLRFLFVRSSLRSEEIFFHHLSSPLWVLWSGTWVAG